MTIEEIKVYQEKFESVQCQINEVIRSEKERNQIRIEVEAILQRYQDYLERDGFGVSEIQLILSKLTFNRVLVN